jgi:hypothetical protein
MIELFIKNSHSFQLMVSGTNNDVSNCSHTELNVTTEFRGQKLSHLKIVSFTYHSAGQSDTILDT